MRAPSPRQWIRTGIFICLGLYYLWVPLPNPQYQTLQKLWGLLLLVYGAFVWFRTKT